MRFVLITAADVCLCGCFHVLRWHEHTMVLRDTACHALPLTVELLVPGMPFPVFPPVHFIIVHAQG